MIDKLVRKFCSEEVRILIKKIENDFQSVELEYGWNRLLATDYMTSVEEYCVVTQYARSKKAYRRAQYLASILRQQLNPKPEQAAIGGAMAQIQNNIQNQLQSQQIVGRVYAGAGGGGGSVSGLGSLQSQYASAFSHPFKNQIGIP